MSQEIVIFRENLASKMCRNVIEALKDPTVAADEEDVNITKFVSRRFFLSQVNVCDQINVYFSIN